MEIGRGGGVAGNRFARELVSFDVPPTTRGRRAPCLDDVAKTASSCTELARPSPMPVRRLASRRRSSRSFPAFISPVSAGSSRATATPPSRLWRQSLRPWAARSRYVSCARPSASESPRRPPRQVPRSPRNVVSGAFLSGALGTVDSTNAVACVGTPTPTQGGLGGSCAATPPSAGPRGPQRRESS